MNEKESCSTCIHRKDVIIPCDWLLEQRTIVLRCPHYEKEECVEDEVKTLRKRELEDDYNTKTNQDNR